MKLTGLVLGLVLLAPVCDAQVTGSSSCMPDEFAAARWNFHRAWFEEADEQFAAYLDKCPDEPLANAYAAIIDMLLYRDNAARVDAAASDDPFVRALASFAEGKLEDAEVDLRRYLEEAPYDRFAAHVLGFTLIDQGRPGHGAEVLSRLLELHPEYYPAKNHLAYALFKLDTAGDAVRVVAEFVAVDPSTPSAWDTQADILHSLGRTEEAIASLSRGLLLDERFAYGFRHMGNLLSSAGNRDAAIAAYRKALDAAGAYGPEFVASVEVLIADSN